MNDKKILNAGKWSLLAVISSKLATPFTQIILAHILSPEIFGIIATITMITSFADLVSEAGFQKYIIQAKFECETEYKQTLNVAFYSNLFVSLFLWILIVLFRDFIATAVGNPDIGLAIAIAAVSIPITSFTSIQTAIFNKEFKFKDLFYIKIGALIIPILITIPLSLILKNYWAMIIGTLAMNLYFAIVLTVKSSWKPSYYYSIKKLKEMFSFCSFAMSEQLLGWANLNIGIFIVGLFFSEYYLGLYKTSMATVNQVIDIFTSTIAPVTMAALSQLQGDESKFSLTYYNILKKVNMFIIPIGAGIFLFRDLFTTILLGEAWLEASGFIGMWAIARCFNMIYGKFSINVFSAKGNPVWGTISQAITLIFLIPTIFICAPLGFEILCIARVCMMLFTTVVQAFFLYKYAKISFMKITFQSIPFFISTMVMSIVALVCKCIVDNFISNIITIIICVVVYFGTLYLFPSCKSEFYKLNMKRKVKE